MRVSVILSCALFLAGCSSGGGGYTGPERGRDEDEAAAQRERDAERASGPEEALGKQAESKGKLRESLEHYVAAIQALPEGSTTKKDFELRKKTIEIVLKLDPAPSAPEVAKHCFRLGEERAKSAHDDAEFREAAKAFEMGLRTAPWDPQGYYNLGLIYTRLNRLALASRGLRLYILAAPDATDKGGVEQKIAELEVKRTSAEGLVGYWTCLNKKGEVFYAKHHQRYHISIESGEVCGITVDQFGREIRVTTGQSGHGNLGWFRARFAQKRLAGEYYMWADKTESFEGHLSDSYTRIACHVSGRDYDGSSSDLDFVLVREAE